MGSTNDFCKPTKLACKVFYPGMNILSEHPFIRSRGLPFRRFGPAATKQSPVQCSLFWILAFLPFGSSWVQFLVVFYPKRLCQSGLPAAHTWPCWFPLFINCQPHIAHWIKSKFLDAEPMSYSSMHPRYPVSLGDCCFWVLLTSEALGVTSVLSLQGYLPLFLLMKSMLQPSPSDHLSVLWTQSSHFLSVLASFNLVFFPSLWVLSWPLPT